MIGRFTQAPTPEEIPSLPYHDLVEHLRLSRVNPGHYLEAAPLLRKELAARSPTANYRCMKCGHTKYHQYESRAARSLLGSVFDVESTKFTCVACSRCSFTEFYSGIVSAEEQALDFLLGS